MKKGKLYLIEVDNKEYIASFPFNLQCRQCNPGIFRRLGKEEDDDLDTPIFSYFGKTYKVLRGGNPLDRRTSHYKQLKKCRPFFSVLYLLD